MAVISACIRVVHALRGITIPLPPLRLYTCYCQFAFFESVYLSDFSFAGQLGCACLAVFTTGKTDLVLLCCFVRARYPKVLLGQRSLSIIPVMGLHTTSSFGFEMLYISNSASFDLTHEISFEFSSMVNSWLMFSFL